MKTVQPLPGSWMYYVGQVREILGDYVLTDLDYRGLMQSYIHSVAAQDAADKIKVVGGV